jgi:hypothetical protein
MADSDDLKLAAVHRGLEQGAPPAPERGPEHEALEVWIGRWINEGHVVMPDGTPGPGIVTSDVYEWMPGRFFVLHSAHGTVGGIAAGATEVVGFDAALGEYRSYLFDSQGNVSTHRLLHDGDTWTYAGDNTRATVEFVDGGRVQSVLHERSDDGGATWVTSMVVTLTKIP